jgi:hypothetical protein
MGYLSSTAQIDAILTKKGREMLASGNFNPTKFALGDSFIDYSLLSLEDGESLILETKIPEASSLGEEASGLKYKLIIDESGKIQVATLDVQPVSVAGSIYQTFIVRVETILGRDESYTVYNENSNLSLNPLRAISELQLQRYLTESGKDYIPILNSLQNYSRLYQSSPWIAGRTFDFERITTRKVGNDTQHSFFVFACVPFSSPVNIRVVGNNSGAIANFTVSQITTQPGTVDNSPL